MTNLIKLIPLLNESYSPFHVVAQLEQLLQAHGYCKLLEKTQWNLKRNQGYYVIRNHSSLIAFFVGEDLNDYHYQIVASHSDSPTFKVKRNATIHRNGMTLLNTEGYGGMLCAPWFDRPLSIAGRVMIKDGNGAKMQLMNIDQDLLMIPNCSIHFNRDANSGMNYNKQKDLLPILSSEEVDFDAFLASKLNVEPNAILAHDLFLYIREQVKQTGANQDFITGSKLDNLLSCYTSFLGLVNANCNHDGIQVCCVFDNEETGSLSKQGACSTFLKDILMRINHSLGYEEEHYYQAIAKSFMISMDNAQAYHPNYPEKYDQNNHVVMNKGMAIKHNANQKYTSDAISSAVFQMLCDRINKPYQHYANRSDIMGGSTLGSCTMAQVSLHAVDIGIPQVAMHSTYEMVGTKDVLDALTIMQAFYECNIHIENETDFLIKP